MKDNPKSWVKTKSAYQQKENTKRNLLKIIKENEPIRYKELLEKSNLSNKWLSIILKEIQKYKNIEKTITDVKLGDGKVKNGVQAYQLTKKGQDYVKGMWMILNEIYEMQNTETSYRSNYFSNSDIFWSLLTELKSPFINYSDFIERISEEYRKLILEEIKRTYLKENDDVPYSISGLMKKLYKNGEFPQPKDNESITRAIDKYNWKCKLYQIMKKLEKY